MSRQTAITPVEGCFSAPSPTRGISMQLSVDKAGTVVAYASGKTAVARYLNPDAPLKGFVYRHTSTVTMAKLSPRGNMCCSGDENGNIVIWGLLPDMPIKYQKEGILSGPIRDAAWSDDQERIVVVADARGQSAAVFSVEGGNTIGSVAGHQRPIASVDFRPARPFKIFSGGQDSALNLHEGPPFKFSKGTSTGFQNVIMGVKFSPSGELVAAVSGAPNVMLLNGQTGDAAGEVKTEHKGTIYSVDWQQADGKRIVTASADKSVHVYAKSDEDAGGAWKKSWSTVIGTDVSSMQYGARFVANGQQVLACGLDGTFSYLASDTGAIVKQERGHSRPIMYIAEAAATAGGDSSVVTAGSDGRAIMWAMKGDTGSMQSVQALPDHKVETFNCFAHTAKGSLAFGGGKTHMSDAALKAPLKAQGEAVTAVACAKLNDDLVVAASRTALVLLDSATGAKKAEQDLKSLNLGGDVTSVAATSGGGSNLLVAVAGGMTIVVFSVEGGGASFSKKAEYKGDASPHRAAVTCLAFSPSGSFLASGDTSRTIGVWDIAKGASLYDDLCFHNGRINAVAFFDDQTLVSGAGDNNVIIWNLAEKSRKIAADAHFGGVTAVAKVGSYVVSAGFSGNINVYKP